MADAKTYRLLADGAKAAAQSTSSGCERARLMQQHAYWLKRAARADLRRTEPDAAPSSQAGPSA